MKLTKDHLPWEVKGQMLWVCPECGSVNAWNWEDSERAKARLGIKEVFISHGSCFDNVCGKCQTNIGKPDSPINAPCYTHSED